MSNCETYSVGRTGIDPYTPSDYRSRFQQGRRIPLEFNLKGSFFGQGQVLFYQRIGRGGLSSAKNPQSQELSELLKQLHASEITFDPYQEAVVENIDVIRGGIRVRLARQFQREDNSKCKCRADEFLQPVIALEKGGHIDAALDVLYDRVDDLLKLKQFSVVDALLVEMNVDTLSVDLILGLLTASLPARSKLSVRSKFCAEAEKSIKQRGKWEDGLFAGLD